MNFFANDGNHCIRKRDVDKMFIQEDTMSDVYFYSMSLVVGVTGGIGSGKTTVCRIFQSFGVPVFYADDEAKLTYTADNEVQEAITSAFGDSIYQGNQLNRNLLAEIIFNDQDKLQLVNSIVHPAVGRRFEAFKKSNASSPYIIKEAAILIESGGHENCDFVVVVSADEEIRIERVTQRDSSRREQVEARVKNQMDEKERLLHADFVVVNNDEPLVPQVARIHQELLEA